MLIKVLTYNIRHARGIDGKVDLDRIASVLMTSGADIICLQEVDRMLPRSGFVHQAEKISDDLHFQYGYHSNFGFLTAGMGNAIISRFPLYSTWNTSLPFLGEPRGLLHCVAGIGLFNLDIFCTHWGLTPIQRQLQSRVVVTKVKAASEFCILCGDLNSVRGSDEIQLLLERANLVDGGPANESTFPANAPSVKIDYILTKPALKQTSSEVIKTNASDHFPVIAEYQVGAVR